MEDVTVRAITIGVGVLVSIITITAVLTYYNTAKDAVKEIGSGVDIAGLYDKSIEDILLKKKCNGTDVQNLLDYFAGKSNVVINTQKLKLYKNDSSGNIVETSLEQGIQSDKERIKDVIKFILPNSKYKIEHNINNEIITINIDKDS